MDYKTYRATQTGTPGRGTVTLQEAGSVSGTFTAATYEGFSKFFGPQGWAEGGSFVFYTLDSLDVGTVLEAQGKKYKVIGGASGRVRNAFYLVRNG